MKPTFTFLLLILLLPFPRLYAQDFWETLPFPDTAHVQCIAVNNQGHIFIGAGSNNTIGGVYRSIDGGLNWEFIFNMGDFGVLSLEINNQGAIYAGTNHGFHPVYVSSTNGETWEEIILPSYGNIVKIYCHGQDTIYVSRWTDNGACLLRSLDCGQTWGEIFSTANHTSEYVSDIAISGTGVIYVSLMCYLPDMGGMYKSEDEGENWEFIGLFNHMVKTLEMNSENDLFAGVWGGLPGVGFSGLYVLRNGEDEWIELLVGPQITEIAINGANHIYMGSHWPDGVLRSQDNGQTFEMVNSGLIPGMIYGIINNNYDYLYAINPGGISKSINSSVFIPEVGRIKAESIVLCYPNPVRDKLFITLPFSFQATPCQINIYDTYGRVIISLEPNNQSIQAQIDVSSLLSGSYILEAVCLFNKVSQMFVKF